MATRRFRRARTRRITRRPVEWAYFGYLHRLGSTATDEGIADVTTHTTGTGAGDVDLAQEQGFDTSSNDQLQTKLHCNVLGQFGPTPGGTGAGAQLAFRQILRPYTILRFVGTLSAYVEDNGNTGDAFFNHAFGVVKTEYNILGLGNAEFRSIYSLESPQVRIGWESFPAYCRRPAGTQGNQYIIAHREIDTKVKIRVERFNTPFLSSTLLVANPTTSANHDQINVRWQGKCLISKDLG